MSRGDETVNALLDRSGEISARMMRAAGQYLIDRAEGGLGMSSLIAVPLLPERPAQYDAVERFNMQIRATDQDWSLENVGELARLASDLRSDASYLETLAADVDRFIADAVEIDRMRDTRI